VRWVNCRFLPCEWIIIIIFKCSNGYKYPLFCKHWVANFYVGIERKFSLSTFCKNSAKTNLSQKQKFSQKPFENENCRFWFNLTFLMSPNEYKYLFYLFCNKYSFVMCAHLLKTTVVFELGSYRTGGKDWTSYRTGITLILF
jgi:hypothetical protein